MAKPIAPTPELKGEDAERFWKNFNTTPSKEKKAFLMACLKAYESNPFD